MPERKPPLIRCQCGRLHRSWNPRKVCVACIRESSSAKQVELSERARERERSRLELSPELRAKLEAGRERWLGRQSLDHPWRVARREEAGVS